MCIAVCSGQICADAADAEQLIACFDSSSNRRAVANEFLKMLLDDELLDEKIVITPDVPDDSLRQVFYYWTGEWYCDRQDFEKSLAYGLKALPLYHGKSTAKADCLNLLGVVNVRLGNFTEGADYAKQCVDIVMTGDDNYRIAHSISTLAGTYLAADKPDDAHHYALLGLEYADKAKDSLCKTILLGMASEANYKLQNYEAAFNYARTAHTIDSIEGRWMRVGIRLSQEAAALIKLRRFDQAEKCYAQAEKLLIDAGNYHSLAINYNHLGYMMLDLERNSEAITYFRKAGDIFHRMGDLYNHLHSQRGLVDAYWHEYPDSARRAMNIYNVLKDSLYNQASANALARYKVEFDTDLLKEEITKNKADHRRNLAFIAGALVLLTIGSVCFHRHKIKGYRLENKQLMAKIDEINAIIAEKSQTQAQAPYTEVVTEMPSQEATTPSSNVLDIELRVVQAVNEGLATGEFSVAQIASRLNMGEQTFRRRFIEATGKQPKAYITAIQMNKAAAMLTNGNDAQVAEVALECGFDELSAFSHAFKRTFGCSPSEYRRRANEQN